MRLEKIGTQGEFVFAPELEPVWGAIGLLSGEDGCASCAQLYGEKQIAAWKRKYHFLFETAAVLDEPFVINLMDVLLQKPVQHFTMDGLREAVCALPPAEFVWRMLGLAYRGGKKETLEKALTDDDALEQAYGWVAEHCPGFLTFEAFVRHSGRFVSEFFALALELRTPQLEEALLKQASGVEELLQRVLKEGKDRDLLQLSEDLMGKTFKNRGPYETFVFLPSYLLPVRACRFFDTQGAHKRQLLFLSLRRNVRGREECLKALKVLADPTRYQILTLLAQEGPMRGMDVAQKVSVATSTISHHMEQMKACGLITEEPVKNAKYYGLSKQGVQTLLDEIARDFKIP